MMRRARIARFGPAAAAAVLVAAPRPAGQLAPTAHPPLPKNPSELWLVPADSPAMTRAATTYEPLAQAAAAIGAGDFERALTLASRPAFASTPLAGYAAYYKGLAQLRLSRPADARDTFASIKRGGADGYLPTAVDLATAEAATALGDHARALGIYERLAADKQIVTDQILRKLADAARAAGDRKKAAEALLRVYYEYPLTDSAVAAAADLEPLRDLIVRQGYKADLGRAVQLYGARRYADARTAFAALQPELSGDDKELAELRIAESDYFLQRYQQAVDASAAVARSRRPPGGSAVLHAQRAAGPRTDDEFLALTRALVNEFPDSSWSEEALNNLGTYYILENDDEGAAAAFARALREVPHRPARRAGRVEVRGGGATRTATTPRPSGSSRSAAGGFPRSDYRPSFLYWSARSHGKLGAGDERAGADAAGLHRLRQLVLRPAGRARPAAPGARPAWRVTPCRQPGRRRRRRRRTANAPIDPPAAGGRAVRRRAERVAACAAGVGHVAGRSTRRSRGPTTARESCGARSR